MRTRLSLACALLVAPLAAQLPQLRAPAAVPLLPNGSSTALTLTATPGQPYAIFADITGGPVDLFGERLYLGLTSGLVTIDARTSIGVNQLSLPIPPLLVPGGPIYFQAVVIDPIGSRNGLFLASNGESLIPYPTQDNVIVERFDDPIQSQLVGNFDHLVRGRLQGGPVRRRVHSTIDPQGTLFQMPIQTPLNPSGTRAHLAYRARDLGATGEEELVVAVRWRPRGAVSNDTFSQIELGLTHTSVEPDYTIDPFSALPRFPSSGLFRTFARNFDPGAPPVTVYSGPYRIRPRDQRADRYMPYPPIQPFAYDGSSTLLVEFKVPPQGALGINGQTVYLMVQSSPMPAARNVARGSPATPLDPNQATRGAGDNAMADYQFEFVRVKTTATSIWNPATIGADYGAPFVASSVPAGSSLRLEFRGADDAAGSGATAWSSNIDGADGKPFLQYRATFTGDLRTGRVPSIDTLVIPYR